MTGAQAPAVPHRGPGTAACAPVSGWPRPGRAARAAAATIATGLAAELRCEVTPHPVLPERFEAVYPGGVMIGAAAELRASDRAAQVQQAAARRLDMLAWLWWFRSRGRG